MRHAVPSLKSMLNYIPGNFAMDLSMVLCFKYLLYPQVMAV